MYSFNPQIRLSFNLSVKNNWTIIIMNAFGHNPGEDLILVIMRSPTVEKNNNERSKRKGLVKRRL